VPEAGLENSGPGYAGGLEARLFDAGLEEAGLEKAGLKEAGFERAGFEKVGLEDAGLEVAGLDKNVSLEDAGLEEASVASSPVQLRRCKLSEDNLNRNPRRSLEGPCGWGSCAYDVAWNTCGAKMEQVWKMCATIATYCAGHSSVGWSLNATQDRLFQNVPAARYTFLPYLLHTCSNNVPLSRGTQASDSTHTNVSCARDILVFVAPANQAGLRGSVFCCF
jgi:hypothetical protein